MCADLKWGEKRFGMDLNGYVVADPANAFQNLKAWHNKKM
jgi:hypothetical protein